VPRRAAVAGAAGVDPLGGIGDVVGAGVNAITGGLGGAAVSGFGGILKALFAWPARLIDRELLAWLVAVPDYAISPDGAEANRLAALGATTSAMAFAGLGAVATVSGLRYWAAGLSGSGGFEALEGLARTVGAALFIVLWPWLFRHAAGLTNAAAGGLLASRGVLDDTSRLLAGAFAGAISFNFFSIVIACAAGVLFLALLLSKIMLSAGTALIYVAMPLPVALWVLPELAWGARAAMRAFAAMLAVPLAWAVCFATYAAVGSDALALQRLGAVGEKLIRSLVALALLWLTVVVPRSLLRMALFSAAGGGTVARAATYLALHRADAAIAHTVAARAGSYTASGAGKRNGDAGRPRPARERRGGPIRDGRRVRGDAPGGR